MAAPKLLAEWFWTDRWMGSSAFSLPLEARGLYREMLTQAWRRDCRLPDDAEAIRRIVGCTLAEWKRCWPKIAKYWRIDGRSLVNDTQIDIYRRALAGAIKASDRARDAALARWDKRHAPSTAQAMPDAVPGAVPEQCPLSLSLSPVHEEQDQEQSPPKARRPVENRKAVENPKLPVLIRLVHAVLDDHPEWAEPGQLAELAGETKQRAATARLAYTSLAIAVAIDQALAQRVATVARSQA